MKGERIGVKSEGNSALIGYCAARSGNSLPTFGANLSVPFSWLLEDWSYRLTPFVGKGLPLFAA